MLQVLESYKLFEQKGSMVKLLWGHEDQFEQSAHGQERD
jgi:hypothetical protein